MEAEWEKHILKRRRQYHRQYMRIFFDILAMREGEVFRNDVVIDTNDEKEMEELQKL